MVAASSCERPFIVSPALEQGKCPVELRYFKNDANGWRNAADAKSLLVLMSSSLCRDQHHQPRTVEGFHLAEIDQNG